MRVVMLIVLLASSTFAGCAMERGPRDSEILNPKPPESGGIIKNALQGLSNASADGWNFGDNHW